MSIFISGKIKDLTIPYDEKGPVLHGPVKVDFAGIILKWPDQFDRYYLSLYSSETPRLKDSFHTGLTASQVEYRSTHLLKHHNEILKNCGNFEFVTKLSYFPDFKEGINRSPSAIYIAMQFKQKQHQHFLQFSEMHLNSDLNFLIDSDFQGFWPEVTLEEHASMQTVPTKAEFFDSVPHITFPNFINYQFKDGSAENI